MRVGDLRAGGMGIPEIFKLNNEDLEFLAVLARFHAWTTYGCDIKRWESHDLLMWHLESCAKQGGGMDRLCATVDEFAEDLGLERV